MGADALLGRAHEVEAHHPLVERDFAALHDGAGRDAEILPTGRFSATIDAGLLGRIRAANQAAMGTNCAIRPAQALNKRAGCVLIGEVRGIECV